MAKPTAPTSSRPSPFEDPNESPWRAADVLQVGLGSLAPSLAIATYAFGAVDRSAH